MDEATTPPRPAARLAAQPAAAPSTPPQPHHKYFLPDKFQYDCRSDASGKVCIGSFAEGIAMHGTGQFLAAADVGEVLVIFRQLGGTRFPNAANVCALRAGGGKRCSMVGFLFERFVGKVSPILDRHKASGCALLGVFTKQHPSSGSARWWVFAAPGAAKAAVEADFAAAGIRLSPMAAHPVPPAVQAAAQQQLNLTGEDIYAPAKTAAARAAEAAAAAARQAGAPDAVQQAAQQGRGGSGTPVHPITAFFAPRQSAPAARAAAAAADGGSTAHSQAVPSIPGGGSGSPMQAGGSATGALLTLGLSTPTGTGGGSRRGTVRSPNVPTSVLARLLGPPMTSSSSTTAADDSATGVPAGRAGGSVSAQDQQQAPQPQQPAGTIQPPLTPAKRPRTDDRVG